MSTKEERRAAIAAKSAARLAKAQNAFLPKSKQIRPICLEPGCKNKAAVSGKCFPHYKASLPPQKSEGAAMLAVVDLDDELLTKVAEKPSSAKDKVTFHKSYTEIQMFCIVNKIKPGHSPVSQHLVYELYKQWRGENFEQIEHVLAQFRKWFERKSAGQDVFYYVDVTPFLGLMEANIGYLHNGYYRYAKSKDENK